MRKILQKKKEMKPLKTLDENFLSTDYKLKSLLYLKINSNFIKSKNGSLNKKYNKTTKRNPIIGIKK